MAPPAPTSRPEDFMTTTRRTLLQWTAACLSSGAVPAAFAQADSGFGKPVHFIVPYSPGGSTSFVARLVGDKVAELVKQPVPIENRPGGNTVIGMQTLARAPADGSTIGLAANTHLINGLLMKSLPYHPSDDFVAVATLVKTETILVVHPSVPAKTLPEFVALLKAKPGEFNMGSVGSAGITRLVGEMFLAEAGLKALNVAYPGTAPMLTDLVGGRVHFTCDTPVTSAPFLRDGRLRALAVTGDKRLAAFPDVPTYAEQGVNNMDVTLWFAVLAPAGTPKPAVARLNAAINRALAQPEVRSVLDQQFFAPYITSPEETAKMLQSDQERYRQIIARTGIKLEQ
jgi:tripartite-type tricarboxylate transporter receptor subunit TctC